MWHYEFTVKMAFFICFHSVLAVLAAILKMSLLDIIYAAHIVSFKYLPIAWALIYGKKKMAIDMELENTVFLITSVQFSVARIIILFIQFSNTSYFVMYMFFLLISRDFAKFY